MNLGAERTRLLRRDAEWAAAAADGQEVELILSFWTEDEVVMPAGFPAVVGKEALRRYVEGSRLIPGFIITWESADVTFSPDGSLAYMLSRNAVTMNDEAGTPVTTAGRAVTIRRREQDGAWRCAVDIWNAGPDVARAVSLFRREADRGGHAELKTFADGRLPALEEHLRMARELAGGNRGGRTTGAMR